MVHLLWQFVAFLLGVILVVFLLGITAIVIIEVVKAIYKVARGGKYEQTHEEET